MTLGCFLLLMFYVAKFEKVRYNYFIIYLECSDMDKNSKYTFFPHQFSSIRIEEMLDKFNTYDEFEKVFLMKCFLQLMISEIAFFVCLKNTTKKHHPYLKRQDSQADMSV